MSYRHEGYLLIRRRDAGGHPENNLTIRSVSLLDARFHGVTVRSLAGSARSEPIGSAGSAPPP